jgi:hypothetical protein
VASKCNQIVQDMWDDYQGILLGHGLSLEYDSSLCLSFFHTVIFHTIIFHTTYDKAITMFLWKKLQQKQRQKTSVFIGSQALSSWSITHAFLNNPLHLSSI